MDDQTLPPPTDHERPTPHPFAAVLRQKRVIATLSQKRLARLSGVSESWIRLLEQGVHRSGPGRFKASQPNPRDTARLATVLEWDIREALTVAGHDPDVVPKVELPSLEERIGRLTPREVAIVERVLAEIGPTPTA
jgi:transcriptional regulator with XRE-family HTH domain